MNRKRRLLVVEDEPAIQAGLVDVFVYHGFEVEATGDGREGLHLATTRRFDLVVLDVMLPGINGFEICEQIRERDRDLPIIMLTAKTGDEDIVNGLRLGADDYVAKPFGVQELVLRVEAVLRRAAPAGEQPSRLEFGNVKIDCTNLEGDVAGETVRFTRREIDILIALSSHTGNPVSRETLLHEVWGYARHQEIETRTVDIHIAKLRRKIEAEPASPKILVTVRGAGYKLVG